MALRAALRSPSLPATIPINRPLPSRNLSLTRSSVSLMSPVMSGISGPFARIAGHCLEIALFEPSIYDLQHPGMQVSEFPFKVRPGAGPAFGKVLRNGGNPVGAADFRIPAPQ